MKRFALFLIGLVGLPLIWSLAYGVILLAGGGLDGLFTARSLWFCAGCALMVALYLPFGRALMSVYVFAHEMTHALAGLLCLAKIHEMRVGRGGGHVILSKSNVFIVLAPYCVPFYFMLLVLIRWGAEALFPDAVPGWIWNLLQGVTLAFHVLYTGDALLGTGQPDVRVYGRLFSYWLILCVNLFLLLVALCVVIPVSPGQALDTLIQTTGEAYKGTWTLLKLPVRAMKGVIS